MKINIDRLISNYIEKIEVNDTIIFDNEYIKNTDIRKLDNILVKGSISKSEGNIYNLNLSILGNMILPCAVTLEDVIYPFSLEINEILTEDEDDDEKYLKISNNYIDIRPIIWQNIILEVPIRVVKEDIYKVNRSGDGWKLIDEENIDKGGE